MQTVYVQVPPYEEDLGLCGNCCRCLFKIACVTGFCVGIYYAATYKGH